MDLDTSWCPVCSREIVPKRYQVPIAPPQPAAPAPPPSSPSSNNGDAAPAPRTARTKSTNARTKAGLAHGTGRVKPNGAVKRTESCAAIKTTAAPAPVQPAAPIRHRTVIDQGPIPLYCSDECRLSDINSTNGFISLDYDPHRESVPTPAVPNNSYANLGQVSSGTESDSSSGETSSDSSWSSNSTKVSQVSPSMATLAALYNFPPMPAPAPILEQSHSQSSTGSSEHNFNEYHSGVMMAARRIKAALCPEVAKVNAFSSTTTATSSAARKPIPGWTDGSDDWRSTVYSLAAPQPGRVTGDQRSAAHMPFSASSHHSQGVNSTVSDIPTPYPSTTPVTKPAPQRKNSEELYSKYPLSYSKRSDSRTSLYTAASSASIPPVSSSTSLRSSQRQKSLLKKGAEGKLLVPDVKLKPRSPSVASFDGHSLASYRSATSYPASSQSVRSPLSRHGSDISDDSDLSYSRHPTSLPPVDRRPVPETRSWSYDNLMTYPVMPLPCKKEKRIQRQVVDGVERDVVVEVEITQPFKRLFLFADKETTR